MDDLKWKQAREHTPEKLALARQILDDVRGGKKVSQAVRDHPLPGGDGYLGKHLLVAAYNQLVESGAWKPDQRILERIRMKPVRTLSGVTVVTVLTKPYPCPGKCIFCPTDVRMPKSYLPDEPGAMRALHHDFDPYQQVAARLDALQAVGHPTDKIELLILGGTWSAYRRDYQEWFILRCFEAMNGQASQTLEEAQSLNENAGHRNVGLVIETRPDYIDKDEISWLRHLGVTKVQLGAQSMDDRILDLNKRGHSVADTERAVALLRAAGFKIVLHWMPNLLGATLASDREDFSRLWDDLCPDELKIYPNQLLEDTELYEIWEKGGYRPYTTGELVHLIADIKPGIPEYCRVNRVVRDIPSTHVVAGNKRTSLRQDIHKELRARGSLCGCIRCREIRGRNLKIGHLELKNLTYSAGAAEEHFISFDTQGGKLAGFIRLSLPRPGSPDTGLSDLEGAAIIREIHVYGQSLEVGEKQSGVAQHMGLGTELLDQAEMTARNGGYECLAVISAVGTRQYYLQRGFKRGELYLVKDLH